MIAPTPATLIGAALALGLAAPITSPAATTTTVATSTTTAAPAATPVLTAVRSGRHATFERVVFEFSGPMAPQRVSTAWAATLIADGSGLPVPIAGSAILTVQMHGAQAHTPVGQPTVARRQAHGLTNVISTVRSGDFEAVVSYGIGLARRADYRVFTLSNPARVVVDIDTPPRTRLAALYLTDSAAASANRASVVARVYRRVPADAPATALLHHLYAGPTPAETRRGLITTTSRSTSFTRLRIDRHGIAHVRLVGGCGGGSAVVTVADQIRPTLKQFSTVRWVKIYDPAGRTQHPTGLRDSIPDCLEP